MIELAVDNGNVTPIGTGNLMDIPGMARRFADQVESGGYPNTTRAIVIIERDDGLSILSWGEATTAYELMGLFEASKLRVFADDLVDDE